MISPENFIGYLIKSSGRVFANQVNAKIKELGLPITVEQVGIIFRLSFFPGSTQKDIADFFFKDKTTITRIIGTMERNNILVRVPSEKDKRINLLYLTNKGKEVQGIVSKVAMEASSQATEGIDEKDLEIAKRVLKQIRENLEK